MRLIIGYISAVTIALLSGVEAFQHPKQSCYSHAHPATTKLALASVNALINIQETAPRDVPSMEAWTAACGVQRAEGLQLQMTGDADNGNDVSVMTTQDLPANTCVLLVPNTMVLSSNQAMQEIGYVEAVEALKGSTYVSDQYRHLYLIFKILMEYEQGENSPWYPWLNSLPRYYTNGASMTPFCYRCLPPLVEKLAREERAKLSTLRVILPKVPFFSEQTRDDRDLSKWAFQIAYTRSFEDGAGNLCISPMADMFNHVSYDPEVAVSYDEQGNCYAHTTRNIPAGSPLRMSYPGADPTNPSFIFARYGFLDETSPATFCKIMIKKPQPELIDLGYAPNRMLFYKDTGDVSEEVFDVLLYQHLATDPATQQAFYQAHMQGDITTKQAFHQQYWGDVSLKLQTHIDTFLQELEQLAVGDSSRHPRLPLIWKHNRFVKQIFLAVRARYFG